MSRIAQRIAFGRALAQIGASRPNMVVLDPDVCTSTQTALFRERFPDRFYSVGIAEANAVCVAAGMASCGLIPWVSTFAVFLASRAADQIRVSVAHTGLPVKLNGSYGGLPTGRAGATHSSIEDLAIMRVMPDMLVLTPADEIETRIMTALATDWPGPVYLRTVRCEVPDLFGPEWHPVIGKAVELAPGRDIAILAEGMMSHRALEAAQALSHKGISARVLHFGTVKPLDREAVLKAADECGILVTVENHSREGGFGSAVAEIVSESAPCRLLRLGFPDRFMESGDDDALFSGMGLDAEGIALSATRALQSGKEIVQ